MFDSLRTIDPRHWIAPQCLSNNFPRSIPKWIKTQVERIAMAPRFKVDTWIHMHNFQIYVTLREEKKTKLPKMKVWMVRTVRRFVFFFVIFYYNDFVVSFQRLIAASKKQTLRILINMPEIYFFSIWYKRINTWTSIVYDGRPFCLFPLKAFSMFWYEVHFLVHTNIFLHTQNGILLP